MPDPRPSRPAPPPPAPLPGGGPVHLPAPSGVPTILRTLHVRPAAIYVIGGFVGLVLMLILFRSPSPEKVLKELGQVQEMPRFSAQIPQGSAGARSFEEGKRAYEAKDWAGAARAFDMAATEDSRLPQARFWQGMALLGADRPKEAAEIFEGYRQVSWKIGAMPTDEALYYGAKANCRFGQGEKALDLLNQCIGEGGMMIEDCLKLLKGVQRVMPVRPLTRSGSEIPGER